jgi:site-specific recombinase XerD
MKVRIAVPVVTGPLAPHASGFARALGDRGYEVLTVRGQIRLMAHTSRWLAANALDVGDLTERRAADFLEARRAEGYADLLSPKAMVPLLDHLRRLGVLPPPVPATPTAVEEFLECYRWFLVAERGLAAPTVTSYVHVARLFVDQRPGPGQLDFGRLTGAEVIEFVVRECRGRSVGSTAYVVCGLRAFLRFLHAAGHIGEELASAVPAAPNWWLTWLPRSVEPGAVRRLLGSCDRRTRTGRRDFAILVLLVRLGVRRGEVAALRLDDIDWRAGELIVRGKGRREERLPLPADVGEAVAGWLRRGRPRVASPAVFTRVQAPLGPLSPAAVSHVVKAAASRAGLTGINAHRLRHTAATEMLRAGANLAEVGQVLRQRSLLATSIYAKVDLGSLRSVAQPWPGVSA